MGTVIHSTVAGEHMERDPIPISALQHYAFCPRQCALIHVERIWDENRHTAEGRLLHERVHHAGSESRPGVLVCRGIRLTSARLGLVGVADVVEFNPVCGGTGVELPGRDGRWRPVPVEYKRGRPKKGNCDAVQLCAQTLCLEEMLGTGIAEGALFYGKTRRRSAVEFDSSLRAATSELIAHVRAMLTKGTLPRPRRGSHCRRCSLREQCGPDVADTRGYVAAAVREAVADTRGEG